MIVDRPTTAPPPPVGDQRTWGERARPIIISVISTVVVFGAIMVFVTSSENWSRVRKQFFSWEAMRESFPDVLSGFGTSMMLWVLAMALTLVVGLLVAIGRSASGPVFAPVRIITIIYIDLMRGIPVLLLLILFTFGIPALRLPGVPSSAGFWATTAMVLSYSAYVAEVYRSGIDAVHGSQRAAARALGLTSWQTMRFAILPQAIRNVGPAMLNLAIAMQKDVSLFSVAGVREAVREAQIYKDRTFNYSSLIVAALLFLIASIPLARFADAYSARDRRLRLQQAD